MSTILTSSIAKPWSLPASFASVQRIQILPLLGIFNPLIVVLILLTRLADAFPSSRVAEAVWIGELKVRAGTDVQVPEAVVKAVAFVE